ncbi:unnamed protein product [Didymodactylos carnosus]|uniref:Uncharacterized protein n=1 Tax=Didymodactylos carnosus TaxID=1234261 RepID=A0A813U4S8_9BILA|nr:unnamed protein product [Didymodactylos carnosus]CAF1151939.1 unnamed protein product [Didymodactylos carnosus]CAF3607223.1 unnamed protein product [Didymodactylos carnosus]CAF3960153.1 unnamed protein product [Didymodactylos carnosus]
MFYIVSVVIILIQSTCFLSADIYVDREEFLNNGYSDILSSKDIDKYFTLVTTIDKPIHLKKSYGMQDLSINYYPGTMNIILSVPHDGDLKSNLYTRPPGGCKKINSSSTKCVYQHPCTMPYKMNQIDCHIPRGRDTNTRLLALALRYELNQIMNLKPFIIINRIQRSKVDMNRFIDEATFGSGTSMKAWMLYHFYIQHARELIVRNIGKGILFDIHSQDHIENWVEIGYSITSRQLQNGKYSFRKSTLTSTLPFNETELITGYKSLGYFIEKYNYRATPSPSHPKPSYSSYYEWGYIIDEYGAKTRADNFSAIMIESPSKQLLNKTRLFLYAKSLARALADYLNELKMIKFICFPPNPGLPKLNVKP